MVIAYHLVWTVYGTWLPNDPRGSGSHCVAALLLAELGKLHYGRKQKQPSGRVIREFYEAAEEQLLFDVIRFNSQQMRIVGEALAEAICEHQYTCYACAIMPDHVHIVIRKHKHLAEQMIEHLQDAARSRISALAGVAVEHPVWTLGGWKRFLNSPTEVHGTIQYVENNPAEIGRPPQKWPFVVPYDNWPFHNRPKSPSPMRP